MLNVHEIQDFIDIDVSSPKKIAASKGLKYYEAEHDILQCRLFYYNADGILVEDHTRSNIKIPHPFFTELVDQIESYMLSFEKNPIQANEGVDGLQEHLDTYFDDRFWSEIGELISGSYTKGFEYLYGYKNEEDRLAFEVADSMGVIEVRAEDTDDKRKYVIYWYVDRVDKGRKKIKKIQVWNEVETWYFVQSDDGQIKLDENVKINPRPHVVFEDEKGQMVGSPLDFIPFWRFDNNKKQISGLKPIKALIDDYDLMQCGLSNNLTDFDTPIHVISGFQGDNLDELQMNLKTKKIVGVDEGGNVEVRTVDVPYQARKLKADEDEKNIYRFGMGFNSSQVGDGNITNVVIQSRYTLLELKANKIETRLKQFLIPIIKIVLDEINDSEGTDYQFKDVKMDFKRAVMSNTTENIQNDKTKAEIKQIEINTILNAAASIGDEQALKLICEQLDIDFEDIKDQVEKMKEAEGLLGAKKTLEGAVIDD